MGRWRGHTETGIKTLEKGMQTGKTEARDPLEILGYRIFGADVDLYTPVRGGEDVRQHHGSLLRRYILGSEE